MRAVKHVFPQAKYRLCLWHIRNKIPAKFGKLDSHKRLAAKKAIQNVVYDSLSVEEFEDAWEQMLIKHGLRNFKWLVKLYQLHQIWVPAFVKDTFWTSMSLYLVLVCLSLLCVIVVLLHCHSGVISMS